MGRTALDEYRRLREQTDRRSGRLTDMHCKQVTCRPGCHDCCTHISVSPVEYAAILDALRAARVTAVDLPFDPNAPCPFLTAGGLCGIYRVRPLICRTHGLPVAFVPDDHDGDEDGAIGKIVSFCPKNFIDARPDDLDFGPDNTLDLDALNEDLAEINARFEAGQGGDGARPARRIPLRQLHDDL